MESFFKRLMYSCFTIFMFLLGNLFFTGELSWAKPGTTGYTFLTLGVGSRPVSMGEAFVGISDDANAIFWNPAGLGQIEIPELNMTHLEWIQEVKQENFFWVIPLDDIGTVGGGINYLHTQMVSNRNNPAVEETFYLSNLALTFAYARELEKRLLIGGGIKFIRESISIDSLSSTAIAVDLGLLTRLNNNLSFGMAISNLGIPLSSLKDEKAPLPMILRGGIGYHTPKRFLIFALDIEKPIDDDFYLHTGMEFNHKGIFKSILYERIGYIYRINSKGNQWGMLSGLRLGIGFNISKGIQIDYAFQPFTQEIGYTHRVSFVLKFFNPNRRKNK